MVEFTRSLKRGVDSTQASLYAYAKALGNLTGIDTLSRFGEEGVRRNMEEMQRNPPTIASWDDVDSLADFGTYALEAIAEQIPGLGLDAASLATGGGIGAAVARRGALSKIEKATIGKAIKNQVGEEGFKNFAAKRGAGIGLGTALVAQSTGETQMQFDEEGLGDQTGSIMLAGAAKAALDKLPLDSVVRIARRSGVPPSSLPQVMVEAAKHVGAIGAQESATEGMQTFVDQFAIHAHKPETELFSEKNLKEIKESMILGGVVGGAMGGAASGFSELDAYKKRAEEIDTEIDDIVLNNLTERSKQEETEKDLVIPEDPASVDAQLKALLNPKTTKNTVFLSSDTPVPSGLPREVLSFKRPKGTYLTTDADKAALIESTPPEEIDDQNGRLLYDREQPKSYTDGTAIVVEDENGIPVSEALTHYSTFDKDYETLAGHMPEGGRIRVTSGDKVVSNRVQRLLNAKYTPAQRDEIIAALSKKDAQADEIRAILNKQAQRHHLESDIMDNLEENHGQSFRSEKTQWDKSEANVGPADIAAELPQNLKTEEEAQAWIDTNAQKDTNTQFWVAPTTEGFGVQKKTLEEGLAPEPEVRTERTPRTDPTKPGIEEVPYIMDDGRIGHYKDYMRASESEARRALGQLTVNKKLVSGYDYSVVAGNKGFKIVATPIARTVQRTVTDGINQAIKTGKKRESLFNIATHKKNHKEAKLARGTLIFAISPEGVRTPLTTSDLSSMGREVLGAEKVRDMGQDEFAREGFRTALARMTERGWDVSDAYEGAQPRHKDLSPKKRKALYENRPFRSDLIAMMEGNIKKGVAKDDIIPANNEVTRKIHNDHVPYAHIVDSTDYIAPDMADAMAVEVYAWLNAKKLTSEQKEARMKEATPVLQRLVSSVSNPRSMKLKRDGKQVTQDPRSLESEHATYHPPGDITSDEDQLDTIIQESDAIFDSEGNSLASLAAARLKKPRIKKTGLDHTGQMAGYDGISKTELAFAHGIMRELGIHNTRVSVVSSAELTKPLADKLLTPVEVEQIKEFMEGKKEAGLLIPRGDHAIIVINDAVKGDDRLLTIGHEVGHIVYLSMRDAIQENNLISKVLNDAYVKEGRANSTFEEWFADKVVARAGNLTTQPKGRVERIFFEFAKTLSQIWKRIAKALPERFQQSEGFNDAVKLMTARRMFEKAGNVGFGSWAFMSGNTSPEIKEVITPSILQRVFKTGDDMPSLAGLPILKYVFSSGANLRALSPTVADLIEKPSNNGNFTAYNSAKQTDMDQWNAALAGALRRHVKARALEDKGLQKELKAAYIELAKELPTEELSPMAASMRRFLKEFHTYLKENMPPIGEVENYFPHQYNIAAITATPGDMRRFYNTLVDHNVENPQAVMDAILGIQPTPLEEMVEESTSVDLGSRKLYSRLLTDPKLIAALVDLGHLNTDPVAALTAYIYKGVTQATYAKSFADYTYPEGYMPKAELAKLSAEDATARRKSNRKALESVLKGVDLPKGSLPERLREAMRRGNIKKDANGDVIYWNNSAKLRQAVTTFQNEKMKEAGIADLAAMEAMPHAEARQKLARIDRQVAELQRLISHSLGLVTPDRSSKQYKVLAEIRAYEALRTLLFSGIASVPELGLSFVKNRGVLTVSEYSKIIGDSIKEKDSAVEFAQLHGILRDELTATVASEMFDQPVGGPVSKWMPYMFRYNGNEKIVSSSKVLSAAVAREYLLKLSREPNGVRHKRYLNELGVTAEQIIQWDKGGRPFWHMMDKESNPELYEASKAVSNGISRFVAEAILRPAHTDKPTFANNIYGMMIFQLKSFAYAFSRGPVMGVYREFEQRLAEGDPMAQRMLYLLPVAGFMLLLGGISDEMRRRVQSFGQKGTWEGNYQGTSNMLKKWVDRTGVTAAPFSEVLAHPTDARSWAFDLGPTVSHAYELIGDPRGEKDATKKILKSIPVVSQMPELRKIIYTGSEKQ